MVVVEPLVLDRDDRVADRLRHLRVPGEHHAVDAGVELRDEAAVRGVQERCLRQRERALTVVGQLRHAAARRRHGREDDEGNEGESRAPPHAASLPVAHFALVASGRHGSRSPRPAEGRDRRGRSRGRARGEARARTAPAREARSRSHRLRRHAGLGRRAAQAAAVPGCRPHRGPDRRRLHRTRRRSIREVGDPAPLSRRRSCGRTPSTCSNSSA